MSRLKVGSVVAGLSLVAAFSARAQTKTVVLTAPYAPNSGAVTAFGYYMSPYSGTVNGTTQRLNCVDFFHEAFLNVAWNAVQTNLGAALLTPSLVLNTRGGSNGRYSQTEALIIYQEMAYLTDQYPTNPASNPALSTAIQTAIWAIGSNDLFRTYTINAAADVAGDFLVTNPDPNSTGYWINQATVKYSQQSAGYYNRFNILTDAANPGGQEFLYSAPEPGTLILLGTGLAAVIGGQRWNRRRKSLVGELIADVTVA